MNILEQNSTSKVSCANSTADLYERFNSLLTSLEFSEDQKRLALLARDTAALVHADQVRPDGSPYIDHPMRVALSAATRFGVSDLNLLIAALLHDTVEDQAAGLIRALGGQPSADIRTQALSCIKNSFGARVSDVVALLTNPDFDEQAALAKSKGDPRDTSVIKQDLYKSHFLAILAEDSEAFLIKLSDFGENALQLGQLEPEKRGRLAQKYGLSF